MNDESFQISGVTKGPQGSQLWGPMTKSQKGAYIEGVHFQGRIGRDGELGAHF